ncbi:MFS transporter [Cohnella phaseoli]|uniref:Putative MFS family arabinose efflux permease n=1 Tax=Cohnella phaseoli TaxID=456490 RepID=A0A3D9IXM7_9BACL|nr:MFS transporter [Cohnella phaseoli]RED66404.1 putative MFS family arabinose efflux permease [Cohnella phaseoli]
MSSTIAAAEYSSFRYRLIVLLLAVVVAGMSQGLLLPLLSIMLERSGVSSDMNGLNSAAMYIGIFCTMFFIERPVKRYGYRNVIVAGIAIVSMAGILFPLTESLAVWFVLRLLVGVGDSALHYTTQLWIVSSSPAEGRGKYISFYGMAYGIGFSVGPLGINLLPLGKAVPFLTTSAIFVVVLLLVLRLRNGYPEPIKKDAALENRFMATYRIAWFVLIPGLLYGLMESSMNSSFPLYGLRIGLEGHWISLLLLAFGVGSLVLQLPLGMLSDRIGRKPVLIVCGLTGALAFLAIPAAGSQVAVLFLLFAVAGGVVGSFFTLGLAYAADILPRAMLPTANVIASIHFSIGSMMGPTLGGYGIRYVSIHSIFLFLGAAFLVFSLLGFGFRAKHNRDPAQQGGMP